MGRSRRSSTGRRMAIVWSVLLGMLVLLTGSSGSCSVMAPCAAVKSTLAEPSDTSPATSGEGQRNNNRGEPTGEHEAAPSSASAQLRRNTIVTRAHVREIARPAGRGLSALPPVERFGGTRLLIALNVSRT